jgi:hypothetical protein
MKNQKLACLIVIALAVTCGGKAPAAPSSVTLGIGSQSPAQAKAGSPAAYSVIVTKSGQKSLNVSLTVSGLPAGVTAFFRPNPIAFNAGSRTSVKCLLTLTTLDSTPAGTYMFTVTGNYRRGINRKAIATGTLVVESINVGPPPPISSLDCLPDGSARLTCVGVPDQLFFIQATPDVGSPVWATIATNRTDAAGWCAFVEPDGANHTTRFYRTSTVP